VYALTKVALPGGEITDTAPRYILGVDLYYTGCEINLAVELSFITVNDSCAHRLN
jgi:hypothetical protein